MSQVVSSVLCHIRLRVTTAMFYPEKNWTRKIDVGNNETRQRCLPAHMVTRRYLYVCLLKIATTSLESRAAMGQLTTFIDTASPFDADDSLVLSSSRHASTKPPFVQQVPSVRTRPIVASTGRQNAAGAREERPPEGIPWGWSRLPASPNRSDML